MSNGVPYVDTLPPYTQGLFRYYRALLDSSIPDTEVMANGRLLTLPNLVANNPNNWNPEPASSLETWPHLVQSGNAYSAIGASEGIDPQGGLTQAAVQLASLLHYYSKRFGELEQQVFALQQRIDDVVSDMQAWTPSGGSGTATVDDVVAQLGTFDEGSLSAYLDVALNIDLADGSKKTLGEFLGQAYVVSEGSPVNLLAHTFVERNDGQRMAIKDALEGAIYTDPKTGERRHAFIRLMGVPQDNLPE